jgi:hypothetical protein
LLERPKGDGKKERNKFVPFHRRSDKKGLPAYGLFPRSFKIGVREIAPVLSGAATIEEVFRVSRIMKRENDLEA